MYIMCTVVAAFSIPNILRVLVPGVAIRKYDRAAVLRPTPKLNEILQEIMSVGEGVLIRQT